MEQLLNLKSSGLYSNPVILLQAIWVTLAESLNLSESSFLFSKMRNIIPALPTSQCCCEDQMRYCMWKIFETLQNTTQMQAIVISWIPVGPCGFWAICVHAGSGLSLFLNVAGLLASEVFTWNTVCVFARSLCSMSSNNGPLSVTFQTSRTSISDLVPVTCRSTIVSQR